MILDLLISNQDIILAFTFLFINAFILRQILIFAGQIWVSTFSHTSTIFFLPIITFVITSVISDNIALSLGMVGALSIVRFRHPVKSPFELIIYFLCIAMGVSASVSLKWLFALIISTIIIFITLYIWDKLTIFFSGNNLFKTSFAEGNELNTLEISTKERMVDLLESENLISATEEKNNYRYVISIQSKNKIQQMATDLGNDTRVISVHLQC